jgi:hypothetical protein
LGPCAASAHESPADPSLQAGCRGFQPGTPSVHFRIRAGFTSERQALALLLLRLHAQGFGVAMPLSMLATPLGGLGEGALLLWLPVMGVNAQRWLQQAAAAGV